MSEAKNRWNWEVSGFEPRKTEAATAPPMVRRYSISSSSSRDNFSEQSKQALATKVQRLKDKVKVIMRYLFRCAV